MCTRRHAEISMDVVYQGTKAGSGKPDWNKETRMEEANKAGTGKQQDSENGNQRQQESQKLNR